jgi:nitrous oxidase accessory protein
VKAVTRLRVAAAIAAATLVAAAYNLPMWQMTMKAPQYPKGLTLNAYGTRMVGDIRELNILNHYIGMPPLEMPPLETAMFPYGIAALVALCLLSPLHRTVRRVALAALVAMPITILADLQWRLYTFGHTLNPQAPIRLKAFTPPVVGTAHMWNFQTSSMVSAGIFCLVAAALVLFVSGRVERRLDTRAALPAPDRRRPAAAAAALIVLAGLAHGAAAQPLQARLRSAPPGSTVVVDGGVHQGPIVIHGPLTVVGRNLPVIDGGGLGSVVTIDGSGVVFSGFVVRNSGRQVTEEAAGITVTGDRHRIEANDIRDVYFGIHLAGGSQQVVQDNRIEPGEKHGARPGHGISVWHTRETRLLRNRIAHARDGIYLSFTERVLAADNRVTGCRYGMHSMYSQEATFSGNTLTANLLGAALMMSDRLVLTGNRIERHREGSAAYGVLLKDIGDLRAERNAIVGNRVGLYAEGVPSSAAREAYIGGNLIAGNEVGFALQSNAGLTVAGNRIADNLTDVRPLGRELSPAMRWSRDGRGNSWGQYHGYDADRDGVGDVPHQVHDAMDALVRRNPAAQAFLYTPAHLALEAAARMFPQFRQRPLLTDEFPLMAADRGRP